MRCMGVSETFLDGSVTHGFCVLLLSDRHGIASQETEAIANMKIHYIIRLNVRQFMKPHTITSPTSKLPRLFTIGPWNTE
jgi:hypothetical protein